MTSGGLSRAKCCLLVGCCGISLVELMDNQNVTPGDEYSGEVRFCYGGA